MNIDFKNIIQELKRRRVFRVAAVYSGFAFIVFQIIDATFETLGIPTWLGKYTIVALVLGFPIAVGLGWAFDITDKGVVRTKDKPIEHDSRKPFVGNISLSIVAMIAIILAVWGWMKTPEVRSEGYQSIAVLPFDNYMGDASQSYFVDGMTEAIIAELARLKGLRVISRTSVMRYRDTEKSLPEIAEELGVDAIVEGSVLKAGNDVRITAQLIDGLSDEHLWANSFDKSLNQILSLQRDVAGAIAKQIRWTLKPEEVEYFTATEPINSEAYELYLKGWNQRLLETEASLKKAMNYYGAAISLDSNLYQAHAAKVVTHFLLRRQDGVKHTKGAVDKALELAPDAAETQMALAMYNQLFAFDVTGAQNSFERAIEIRPGDAEIRREYGLFLMRMGLFEESLVQLEISKAYDPLSPLSLRDLGMIYIRLGRGQEGIDLINQSLELAPDKAMAKTYRAMGLLSLNQVDAANSEYNTIVKNHEKHPRGKTLAEIRSGQGAELLHYADSMLHEIDSSNYFLQSLLNGLAGDIDKAIYFFEKRVAVKDPMLIFVNEDPVWDPIRHRPEYKQALLDLGFPADQPESFSDMLDGLYGPVSKE
ncbi:MAG: hypothetical protein HQ556_10365 [Candidatus Marinimicrobia bacterium]|nr:hypothetical protein [Candidatus Neomarinimicrobiota bacterium]